MEDSLSLTRYIQICLRIIKISWQLRPLAIVGFFVGAFMEIAASIASIYATAKLGALLAAFVTTGRTDYIWLWLWIDMIALAATGLSFLVMEYMKRILYFAFTRWTINSFLSTLCRIDLQDFYDNAIRNQINKIGGSYIWQMPNLAYACLDLIYAVLRFAAITVVVAQITWWLVPLIAVFLIPSLVGESRLAKMQWFVWDSKGDFRHVFWGLEYIIKQAKGQMELRSTQASKFVLGKIDLMNREFYNEQEVRYKKASRALVPTKLLEVAGTAVGSVALLRQFLSHSISLERYFFLSGALLRVGGALNTVFGTLSRMQEGLLFANGWFQLTEITPKLVDNPQAIRLDSSEPPSIEFRNVSFSYPEQDQAIFTDLNLKIGPGEHVALVGENGAGKSTLIKLLLRFYRPTSGQILINGSDLRDINIESWYARLATLFQDFNHYPLSIAENIEIGRSDKKSDKSMLEKAGAFGGIGAITEKYKHGWDTVLDASFKKGVEPSGGQWQRVALARAFYRNASMIILDEPTSAIDARAEYEIFNNIFEHYQDNTALIVSHRFSTVRRANRIIVLDKGTIVEQGSHQDLMKRQGLYHELFSKQAEGYKN
jgi:ATP-binding cassette subfamily B protein